MNNMEAIYRTGKIRSAETHIMFDMADPLIIEVDMGLDAFDGPWEPIALMQIINRVSSDHTIIIGFRLDDNGKPSLTEEDYVRVEARRNGYRLVDNA